jgi:hypothetical protein
MTETVSEEVSPTSPNSASCTTKTQAAMAVRMEAVSVRDSRSMGEEESTFNCRGGGRLGSVGTCGARGRWATLVGGLDGKGESTLH